MQSTREEEQQQIEKPPYMFIVNRYNKRGIEKHPQVIILEFILSRTNLIDRIEIYFL